MLKHKDMYRTEWKSILRKKYRFSEIYCQQRRAVVSVLCIQKVSAPYMIRRGNVEVSIANAGDTWLQIAIEDSSVWITAMYDSKLSLQQIYFDITNGNDLTNAENPSFDDLFLDVVLDAEGNLKLLDYDELENAFSSGEITLKQFESANCAAKNLIAYLEKGKQELLDFCFVRLCELLSR